jgi:hypothetical protein
MVYGIQSRIVRYATTAPVSVIRSSSIVQLWYRYWYSECRRSCIVHVVEFVGTGTVPIKRVAGSQYEVLYGF